MGLFPDGLATLEPILDCWSICGGCIPGEQRWLVSEHTQQWHQLGGRRPERVLCIFGSGYIPGPICPVLSAESSQKTSNLLVHLFHLTIGLGVIQCQADCGAELFQEATPDLWRELGSTIANNILWGSEIMEHMWELHKTRDAVVWGEALASQQESVEVLWPAHTWNRKPHTG